MPFLFKIDSFLKEKSMVVTVIMLALLPIQAKAFIDFCFPISFTALLFVTGWSGMILYEFGGVRFDLPSDSGLYVIMLVGAIIDLAIVYGIGYFIDRLRSKRSLPMKNYRKKIPIILAVIFILLFIFTFIDPSCT